MPFPTKRAAGVALALVLAACPAPGRPGAERDETPPRRGGTLRALLVGDVDSLDPHHAARPSSWWFARALHRGLLAFPALAAPGGARPVPDLAEALPVVSRDGLRYTFRLRAGVRFGEPDAREVRAADVRESLERVIRSDAGVARFLRVIRGSGSRGRISGITTPDARTVRLRLSRPVSDLVWVLAHPQAAVLPAGLPARGVDPTTIAGAGPYRIAEHAPEERIVLERNDAWIAQSDQVRAAYASRIEATVLEDAVDAVRRVAAGGADIVVEPGTSDAEPPRVPEGVRAERPPAGCTRFLFLNRDVAPFGRRAVRRAVAHAVQRAPLAAISGGEIATGILPPTVLGHGDDPVLREDLGRARALLRDAGPNGGFSTTLVVGDAYRDRREARALRDSLERAGIRARIRTVPPAVLYPAHYELAAARTPMGIATWCADWPGPAGRSALGVIADPRVRRDEGNHAGIRSAALERALERAEKAGNDAAGPWADADRLASGTASIIPLGWPRETVVLSARVRGWSPAPMWSRGDPTALWLAA